MSIEYQTIDVGATAAYPAVGSPQFTCPFEPTEWIIIADAAAGEGATFSFDGTQDAGSVKTGNANGALVYQVRAKTLYLKRLAAGGATQNIRIIARK